MEVPSLRTKQALFETPVKCSGNPETNYANSSYL